MTNDQAAQLLATALASMIMPVATSYLKSCAWSNRTKTIFSAAVSFVLGLITVFLLGQLDFENLIGTGATIYTASNILYQTWFKHLAFNQWLEDQKPL